MEQVSTQLPTQLVILGNYLGKLYLFGALYNGSFVHFVNAHLSTKWVEWLTRLDKQTASKASRTLWHPIIENVSKTESGIKFRH